MSKADGTGPRHYAEDGEWYSTWAEAKEVTKHVREQRALKAQARAILFPKEAAAEYRAKKFEELTCCLRLLQDMLDLQPSNTLLSKDVDDLIRFVEEVRLESQDGN